MSAVPHMRGTFVPVTDTDALDRVAELLRVEDPSTVNTSMRLPVSLRDAAAIAVEHLGAAPSTTVLAAQALRHELETLLLRSALNAIYEEDPGSHPTLAQTALALAQLEGSPLAGKRAVVERAARQVVRVRPNASADDVLLWAQAQQEAVKRP